ncbi:MAG: EamA family transporter [Pseudomonadota bacterium]
MQPILITISAIVSWALLSVVSRVLLVNLDLDPWMFSFLQLVAGGLALLFIGYRGAGSSSSFLRPSTWMLGALRVLSAALYTAVLASISVMEAGIIGSINLPVIAILAWGLSRKPPVGLAWIGHAVVLAAVALMTFRLEADLRPVILGLMGLNAVCLAAMNLIAEHHPENTSATLSGRAWFSGVVLAITAAAFLGLRLLQGGEIVNALSTSLIVSSIAVGVLLRAPSMFLAFWAVNIAGAQSYTAAIALLPLFGMMFEQTGVYLGVLETTRFQFENLYIAVFTLAGTLLVWASKQSFRSRT